MSDFESNLLENMAKLGGYCQRLVGDHDRAEDLVQTTLVKALENRERYKPGTNMPAWLCTIARNAHIDNHRRKTDGELDQETVGRLSSPSAESIALDRIAVSGIGDALSKLREPFYNTLVLSAMGYSRGEISDLTNNPVGTVGSRLNRAKAMLTGALNNT